MLLQGGLLARKVEVTAIMLLAIRLSMVYLTAARLKQAHQAVHKHNPEVH